MIVEIRDDKRRLCCVEQFPGPVSADGALRMAEAAMEAAGFDRCGLCQDWIETENLNPRTDLCDSCHRHEHGPRECADCADLCPDCPDLCAKCSEIVARRHAVQPASAPPSAPVAPVVRIPISGPWLTSTTSWSGPSDGGFTPDDF